MSSASPQDLALRGRIGAYRQHALHDPRETTAKARATFLRRFLDEVDPTRTLPEEERLRRAEYARKAHFAQLAYASAKARARKAQKDAACGEQAATAEACGADAQTSVSL
jgi:hypothetical protein